MHRAAQVTARNLEDVCIEVLTHRGADVVVRIPRLDRAAAGAVVAARLVRVAATGLSSRHAGELWSLPAQGAYGKKLDGIQTATIVSRRDAALPLYLAVASEELRVFEVSWRSWRAHFR